MGWVGLNVFASVVGWVGWVGCGGLDWVEFLASVAGWVEFSDAVMVGPTTVCFLFWYVVCINAYLQVLHIRNTISHQFNIPLLMSAQAYQPQTMRQLK